MDYSYRQKRVGSKKNYKQINVISDNFLFILGSKIIRSTQYIEQDSRHFGRLYGTLVCERQKIAAYHLKNVLDCTYHRVH